LPFITVLPYIIIMLVEAGTAILISDPEKAGGYYYFCIAYSLTYMVILIAVIVLHVKENRSKLDIPIMRYVGKPIVYAVIMTAYVLFASTLRFNIVTKTLIPNSDLYQTYITFTTSIGLIFPGKDRQTLPYSTYQTAIDAISEKLPIRMRTVHGR